MAIVRNIVGMIVGFVSRFIQWILLVCRLQVRNVLSRQPVKYHLAPMAPLQRNRLCSIFYPLNFFNRKSCHFFKIYSNRQSQNFGT